jgi:hypothetical protein
LGKKNKYETMERHGNREYDDGKEEQKTRIRGERGDNKENEEEKYRRR